MKWKHDFWTKIFNLSVELKKRQATVGIWVSGLEDQVEEISQSRAKIQMVNIAKEKSNLEQRPRRTDKWIIGIPEIEKGRERGKALTRQTLAEERLEFADWKAVLLGKDLGLTSSNPWTSKIRRKPYNLLERKSRLFIKWKDDIDIRFLICNTWQPENEDTTPPDNWGERL